MADDILEGYVCEECGVEMEDAPGHPHFCEACAERGPLTQAEIDEEIEELLGGTRLQDALIGLLHDAMGQGSAESERVTVPCVECDKKLHLEDTVESNETAVSTLEQGGPGCYLLALDEIGRPWQVGRVEGRWVGRCPEHLTDPPSREAGDPEIPIEKVGRNDPCPCLSGLKYKKCCGRNGVPADAEGNTYRSFLTFADGSQPEIGSKEGLIIVKVQTALNDSSYPAMVYDRARVFQRFVPAEEVTERMAGRPKAWFYAELKYGQLVLGEEAPAQGW